MEFAEFRGFASNEDHGSVTPETQPPFHAVKALRSMGISFCQPERE